MVLYSWVSLGAEREKKAAIEQETRDGWIGRDARTIREQPAAQNSLNEPTSA